MADRAGPLDVPWIRGSNWVSVACHPRLPPVARRTPRTEAVRSAPQTSPVLQVTDRNVENLSGGELQRFAIAVVATQDADIYMIDEPSSYLDVRQRMKAAQVIRDLLGPDKFVIVVEHDLSVLDYLSDFICCLYGKPGAHRPQETPPFPLSLYSNLAV